MEPNVDLLLKTVSCWTRPGFPPSAKAKPTARSFLFPSEGEISGPDLSCGTAHPRREGDGQAGGSTEEDGARGLSKGRCSTSNFGKDAAMNSMSGIVFRDSSLLVSCLFPALRQTRHDRGASLLLIRSFGVPYHPLPVGISGRTRTSSCTPAPVQAPHVKGLPDHGHRPKAAGTKKCTLRLQLALD